MSVSITVPVYQRRESGQTVWTTLGLGPYNQSHTGGSVVKVQRKLVDKLRKAISGLEPAELEVFQMPRGIELARTRLEFNMRGTDGRFKVAGVFPLIVEPRWINEDQRLYIIYHPHRQAEWFAVETVSQVAESATVFFRHAWAELDQDQIGDLIAGAKDSLKSISFSATPKSLIDKLPARREESKQAGLRASAESGRVLSTIGINQTARAMEGTLPTGMARPSYREQMQLLLGGKGKRPTIVVGPSGAGKTTIIYRWIADLLVEDEFPVHRNMDRVHNVWTVSGKRIIAGMSMLGDWEQRCIDILIEARRRRAILAIEDIHLFGRLGQTRESDRNLAGFFHGPLARGELVMIGECTAQHLQRLENDAPSFAALFSRVHVQPTEPAETLQMMMHLTRELEQRHTVKFHPFTYRSVIELGGSLFPWSAFPGKALDMLRQLTDQRVARSGERGSGTERVEIRADHVVSLMSRHTGLPENLLTLDTRMDVRAVRNSFARHVMGQPAALDAACDLIFRVRAGLNDPSRPLAVNLFTGPTGTGKTEMARCIAEYLFGSSARLLRLDMSEFASPDAPARLIGDRYSPRGLLTQRIREQPFRVVLFDEIEKAHPSVLHLLLQLFDEGRLTDAAGDTASFNHAVIVMTSNLGARPQRPIGFGDAANRVLGEIDKAVRDFFPPELFNRIDKVVPFRPLTTDVAEHIAVKELAKLLARRGLAERNIFVYANQAVKQRIVAEAFDPAHGARTVKRYLEDRVGSLLADEITTAGPAQMRVMRMYESDGELRLHVEPMVETEPADADWMLASMLDHTALRLRDSVGSFLSMIDQLVENAAYQSIDKTIRDGREPDELWYFADVYRARVHSLREWLRDAGQVRPVRRRGADGTVEPPSRASKELLLACMAEACFLSESVHRITDLSAHTALIEVLRVGHGREEQRFGEGGPGLIEWLTEWFIEAGTSGPPLHDSQGSGDDMLEAIAFRFPDGKVRYWRDQDRAEKALAALERRPVQVVIKMTGLCALEAFRGESGCHIWRSLASEPEIVRVRVWSEPVDRPVRQIILDHLDGVRAFEEALESGQEPLPENPESLMPAVRTLHFRPPMRPGEIFTVDAEDFYTGHAASFHVTALRDALRMFFWLRKSRRPVRDQVPQEGEEYQ